MIRRSTAYFYILLTSFVLLAHAVIPHHHHESEIFIVNPDCKTDKGIHKHGTTEHKHKEHNKNDTGYCVIQQVVVVRSDQVKYELKSQDNSDNYQQYNWFKADLYKKSLSVSFPAFLSNVKVLLLSSAYSLLASTALGLRAPPIV